MKIEGMKEEFFEWLDNCPVQWFLSKQDDETLEYSFTKEEDDLVKCDCCGINTDRQEIDDNCGVCNYCYENEENEGEE